ncbi:MAG: phage holin family protein [Bacilli bacterium]|nr:phage holin family protein [Bacilli bacterium]
MSTIIIEENNRKHKMGKFLQWLIYMIGYALILMITAKLFDNTMQLDNSYFGFWALLTAILIFILNKTIKPLIFWLTIPITALTLGFFYPFINVIILQIVDLILGSHFNISGLFMSLIVATSISILNMLMDKLVINPILGKG